jgi:DNA-directed RNA polymerase subunit beta'
VLAEWDPFSVPILSEVGGIIRFHDIVEGVTIQEQVDEVTGLSRKVVVESRNQDLRPTIVIRDLRQTRSSRSRAVATTRSTCCPSAPTSP